MARTLHDRRLERGRRWWDAVSGLAERSTAADRIAAGALRYLDLRPGHAVLDIGCGAGNAFPHLREKVLPGGRILGVDYAPRMVERAGRRASEDRWDEVEVRRVDFSRAGETDVEPESVDRAIAFSTISAMPDPPAAMRTAYRALRPGGRLLVFDMKLRPAGWATPLIWFFDGVYRAVAGWSGVDVLDSARAVFDSVVVTEVPHRPGRPQREDGWPPWTLFVAHKA